MRATAPSRRLVWSSAGNSLTKSASTSPCIGRAGARAVLALSEGDAETADAALAPFVPTFEEHGVPEPAGGFFLPDAIEAMISSGQLERAERLLTFRGVGRPTVSRLGDHGRRPLPGATQER